MRISDGELDAGEDGKTARASVESAGSRRMLAAWSEVGVSSSAKEHGMLRPIVVSMVLSVCGPLSASEVISSGAYLSFVTPHPPYEPKNARFSLAVGYGTPETTIGSTVWFTGPGLFDLSSDPNLSNFVTLATNGVADSMTVTVTDADGFQAAHYLGRAETVVLGSTPPIADLVGLPVTSMRLEIDEAEAPAWGVSMRWQALGVPEPATGTLLVFGMWLLSCKRARCKNRSRVPFDMQASEPVQVCDWSTRSQRSM